MRFVSYYPVKDYIRFHKGTVQQAVFTDEGRQIDSGKDKSMTEQVLKTLFDFQRFSRNARLDALIRETSSRQTAALSERELGYVNAAGVPEMMGMHIEGKSDKDDPWKVL